MAAPSGATHAPGVIVGGRDPGNLPTELFLKILDGLPPRDLWMGRAVPKRWQDVLDKNPFLWRHMDISFFKRDGKVKGGLALIRLAQSKLLTARMMSLEPQPPPYDGTAKWLGFELTKCVGLTELTYSTQLGLKDFWTHENLKSLEIHCTRDRFDLPRFGTFVNLEELVITQSKLTGRFARRFGMRGGKKGSMAKLKRFSISFDKLLSRSDRDLRVLGVAAFTKAAPNLELLELRHVELPTPDQHGPGGLVVFDKLEKCKIECENMLYGFPFLPQSLKELAFLLTSKSSFGYIPISAGQTNPWGSVPDLPNLQVLVTNFDADVGWAPYQPAFHSIWSMMIMRSNCRLRKLVLQGNRNPGCGKLRNSVFPGHADREHTWVSELFIDLAGYGSLSELEHLHVSQYGKSLKYQIAVVVPVQCHNLKTLKWNGREEDVELLRLEPKLVNQLITKLGKDHVDMDFAPSFDGYFDDRCLFGNQCKCSYGEQVIPEMIRGEISNTTRTEYERRKRNGHI